MVCRALFHELCGFGAVACVAVDGVEGKRGQSFRADVVGGELKGQQGLGDAVSDCAVGAVVGGRGTEGCGDADFPPCEGFACRQVVIRGFAVREDDGQRASNSAPSKHARVCSQFDSTTRFHLKGLLLSNL